MVGSIGVATPSRIDATSSARRPRSRSASAASTPAWVHPGYRDCHAPACDPLRVYPGHRHLRCASKRQVPPPVNAQVFHLGIHVFSSVRVPSLAAVEEGHGQKHGDMSVRSARPLQQRSASPSREHLLPLRLPAAGRSQSGVGARADGPGRSRPAWSAVKFHTPSVLR
jgi:hypothetical protein